MSSTFSILLPPAVDDDGLALSVFYDFSDDDDAFAVAAAAFSNVVFVTFSVLDVVFSFIFICFFGDFFFLTLVHSSFLSGWSLVSGCGVSIVSWVISLVVFVDVVVVVVGSFTVFVVVFEGRTLKWQKPKTARRKSR